MTGLPQATLRTTFADKQIHSRRVIFEPRISRHRAPSHRIGLLSVLDMAGYYT